MRDLTELQRAFVREYVLQHVTAKPWRDGKPGRAGAPYAAGVNAARLAGYGKNSKADTLSKHAYDLIRDPKILAAIREESIKVLEASHPEALAALLQVVADPAHRDRVKAAGMILDRASGRGPVYLQ
jgi:phage terminase small subunit